MLNKGLVAVGYSVNGSVALEVDAPFQALNAAKNAPSSGPARCSMDVLCLMTGLKQQGQVSMD